MSDEPNEPAAEYIVPRKTELFTGAGRVAPLLEWVEIHYILYFGLILILWL